MSKLDTKYGFQKTPISQLYTAKEVEAEQPRSVQYGKVLEERYFDITFLERIQETADPEWFYGACLVHLVSSNMPVGKQDVRANVWLFHPQLRSAFGLRCAPVEKMTPNAFRSQLLQMKQSNNDLPPINQLHFRAEIVYTVLPTGSGRKKLSGKSKKKYRVERTKRMSNMNAIRNCPVNIPAETDEVNLGEEAGQSRRRKRRRQSGFIDAEAAVSGDEESEGNDEGNEGSDVGSLIDAGEQAEGNGEEYTRGGAFPDEYEEEDDIAMRRLFRPPVESNESDSAEQESSEGLSQDMQSEADQSSNGEWPLPASFDMSNVTPNKGNLKKREN